MTPAVELMAAALAGLSESLRRVAAPTTRTMKRALECISTDYWIFNGIASAGAERRIESQLARSVY